MNSKTISLLSLMFVMLLAFNCKNSDNKLNVKIPEYIKAMSESKAKKKRIETPKNTILETKTKSITTYMYETNYGKIVEDNNPKYKETYNREGKILEKIEYYGSDSYYSKPKDIYKKTEYKYFADGSYIVREKNTVFKNKDTKVTFFNINGKEVEETNYSSISGDVDSKTLYKYNDRDSIESKMLYKNGYLTERTIFKYDTNLNITEQTTYNGNGEIKYNISRKYKYDSLGKMNYYSEIVTSDNIKNQDIRSVIYQLDDFGNIIYEHGIFHDLYHNVNIYNEEGYITKSIGYSDDTTITYTIIYNYDTNGNLIEHYMKDAKTGLKSYNYITQFDANNNIIEIKRDNKNYSKTTRKYDDKFNVIESTSYNEFNEPTTIYKSVYTYY